MRLVPASPAAAAALIAAAALAACGGDGSSERADHLPGNPRAGAGGALSQAPEANCEQWRRGSPRQRARAVEELGRVFARGGSTLPADRAYTTLQRACSQRHARKFKLWKIYTRALAFEGSRAR